MKLLYTIIHLFLSCLLAGGQNLVENPSFESYNQCPTNYTLKVKGELIPGWTMPTYGTSDYFNACSRYNVSVPSNMMGNLFPADGKAYTGIIVLQDPPVDEQSKKPLNYREYLQSKLLTPLIKGNKYIIRLWYAPADHSTYRISSIGILLTAEPVKQRKGVLNYEPSVETDSLAIHNKHGNWYELSDTLVASGHEQYLTIGNFKTDLETSYVDSDYGELPKSMAQLVRNNRIAYYYIDEVEVILLQ